MPPGIKNRSGTVTCACAVTGGVPGGLELARCGYAAGSRGGFAVLVAIASARSGAVVRRIGRRTLSLGTGHLVLGMTGVILTLQAAGTGLQGYQLLPCLAVGGAGAGLFLAW